MLLVLLAGCGLTPESTLAPTAKAEASCTVSLLGPDDAAAAPTAPTFSWDTDCDAVVLELSPDASFDTASTWVLGSMTQDSVSMSSTRWRRAVSMVSGTLHWRVVGGQGPDTAVSEVRTLGLPREGTPLEGVSDCSISLGAPGDGAFLDPAAAPTFAWSDDCGGKQLEISSSPTFDLADTLVIGAMDRSSHTLGAALWSALEFRYVEGGYWRIVAGTDGGDVQSDAFEFTTTEPDTTPTDPGNPPVVYYTDVLSAQIGDFVGLYGRDFGDTAGEVRFGDAVAEVHSWTHDEVYVITPDGANGDLHMTTDGGSSEAFEFAIHEGNKIHVSPDGDDSNPGTEDQPLATLEEANDIADPGDTILVREGTYAEEDADVGMYFSSDGEEGLPITLRAYPGERVIMDGSIAPKSVLFIGAEHSATVGFEVTNANDGGISVWSDDVRVVNMYCHNNLSIGAGSDDSAHGVVFLGNTFHDNDSHGIYVRSNNGLYAYNDSYNNGQFGIQVYDNASEFYTNVLDSNRTWGNGKSGIIVSQKTHDTLVQNNLSWSNGRFGIDLRYGPTDVTIVHNTTWDNDDDEIHIDNATDVVIRNNIFEDDEGVMLHITEEATGIDSDHNLFSRDSFEYHGSTMDLDEFRMESGGEGVSWIEDPGLLDPENGDFSPMETSPAIDAADPTYSPEFDITLRARDAQPDMGAIEYQ